MRLKLAVTQLLIVLRTVDIWLRRSTKNLPTMVAHLGEKVRTWDQTSSFVNEREHENLSSHYLKNKRMTKLIVSASLFESLSPLIFMFTQIRKILAIRAWIWLFSEPNTKQLRNMVLYRDQRRRRIGMGTLSKTHASPPLGKLHFQLIQREIGEKKTFLWS